MYRRKIKLQFCTLVLPKHLLLSNFSHFFLNNFKVNVNFWVVLIPIFKFCEEKVSWSYWHFFETLRPTSKETAQNFEINILQKLL
jgi:hypothetical protein